MLNPLHLRTLIVVLEAGSFADAARRLGYTSSAVSQQISALERAVKLLLFARSAQSVQPTPAAVILAERARSTLANMRLLEDELASMAEGRRGILRLGSFPTASEHILPATFAHLYRDFPDLEISLDEGEPRELTRLLLDADLDAALVYHYDLVPHRWPDELQRLELFSEDVAIILPQEHPLLSDEPEISLYDLSGENWIAPRTGMAGSTCLERLCAIHEYEPRVVVRSNDYDVVSAFVSRGLGVAVVPALSRSDAPGIALRAMAGVQIQRHVSVLFRAASFNPLVEVAVAALRNVSLSFDPAGGVTPK